MAVKKNQPLNERWPEKSIRVEGGCNFIYSSKNGEITVFYSDEEMEIGYKKTKSFKEKVRIASEKAYR